jgi:hypothetical protein
VNGDWKLRNITSDIEGKEIEITLVDIERKEKRE